MTVATFWRLVSNVATDRLKFQNQIGAAFATVRNTSVIKFRAWDLKSVPRRAYTAIVSKDSWAAASIRRLRQLPSWAWVGVLTVVLIIVCLIPGRS